MADADELFEQVKARFPEGGDVTTGRMFGSSGLKVDGKIFAMAVKGRLVVKLPRERVQELIESGEAEPFDPGHGRVMKEWVAVPPTDAQGWAGLAEEAFSFVGSR